MSEYPRSADVERRECIWLSPCPGVAYPGVVLWRRFGFVKVLYWVEERQDTTVLFMPSKDVLIPRSPESHPELNPN